jgi:hypothetical protein
MFLPEACVNPFPCIGKKRAVVAKPRACTLCRECIKVAADKVKVTKAKVDDKDKADGKVDEGKAEVDNVEVEPQIELRRVRDHFICK